MIHKGKFGIYFLYSFFLSKLSAYAKHNIIYLHRDLAFGLFCGGNENESNPADAGGHHAPDESENEWSIPGAHTPVAVMIHSWLETCQNWPIPRAIEDGNIPFHFEEVLNEQENVDTESNNDMSPGGRPPPAEIILSARDMLAPSDHNSDPNNNDINSGEAKETTAKSYRKFSFWGDLVDLSRFDWW